MGRESGNNPIKGGCRVTASAIPGMYYEKVLLQNVFTSAFLLFDDISIFYIHEEIMLNK